MEFSILTPAKPLKRKHRIGRPPSLVKKVSMTIRLPEKVHEFLRKESEETGKFMSDLIVEAVVSEFRLPKRRMSGSRADRSKKV
jgi:hypothetical protein